jgi:hypothetical protein
VGLELGLKGPLLNFRLVYVSEIQIQALRLRLPPPLPEECDSSLERTPTGTARHGPGQPRAGHARTTGAGTVGKDWLARIGDPAGEGGAEQMRGEERRAEESKADRQTGRQTDTEEMGMEQEMTVAARMHACNSSLRWKAALPTHRRATATATTPPAAASTTTTTTTSRGGEC